MYVCPRIGRAEVPRGRAYTYIPVGAGKSDRKRNEEIRERSDYCRRKIFNLIVVNVTAVKNISTGEYRVTMCNYASG